MKVVFDVINEIGEIAVTDIRNIKEKGFTLIELIGVMAVIAILAATIAPSFVREIDRSLGEAEKQNLSTLANELKMYIEETKTIPSITTWESALASVSKIPLDKISQNQRLHDRRYYVDPRFFTISDTVFAEYSQTVGLAIQPVSPRIIIASNLKGTLPSTINSSSDFNAVWDQTSSAPISESTDIIIERINLKGGFHRILLSNVDTANSPGYRLESGTVQSVSGSLSELYILSGTKVSLYESPFTSNMLYDTFLVNSSNSFSYNDSSGAFRWEKL